MEENREKICLGSLYSVRGRQTINKSNRNVKWWSVMEKNRAGMDRQREQTGTDTGTADPEKEGGIGVKGPGDRNRESRPRGRGENKQEKWEVKGQGQIGGEGTRQGRGQSRVEGSPPPAPAPLPGRAVVAMGTEAAGAQPVARPDAHIGGLVGPPETWCSQRQLGLFPLKPPPPPPAPAPFPWPRSRGDPELEKTPRQAPRSGAAKRETGKCQGSSKPKCENSFSLRKPRGPVGRLWRGWEWGGRGLLAAGGPAVLHSGEHLLHTGLGSHVIDSNIASQATTPQ